jgi:hypothetical protein
LPGSHLPNPSCCRARRSRRRQLLGPWEAEGLDLLQIGAPVFQVYFMIGLTGKYKYLPHDSHCLPRSVVGIELIAMPSCTLHL